MREAADWADDTNGAALELQWATARDAAAAHDRARLDEVQARNALEDLRTSFEAADWADDTNMAARERQGATAPDAETAHDRARLDDRATACLAAILDTRSRLLPPLPHIPPPPSPSPAPPPPPPILQPPSPPRYGVPFGTAQQPSRQLTDAPPGVAVGVAIGVQIGRAVAYRPRRPDMSYHAGITLPAPTRATSKRPRDNG